MDVTLTLVAAFAIVLTAGAISGLTGFGFALVSVPPLLLLFDPPTVVALGKVATLTAGWALIVDAWREIRVRDVLALLPWAFVGLAAGSALLTLLSAAYVKLLASAVVIGFALLLLRGERPRGGEAPWATAVAGLTSGTLATSVGLSGPPVVLLFTLRGYGVHAFRTTIATYFLAIDLVGLPLLLLGGAIGPSELASAAILAPAGLGGRLLGMRLARRVGIAAFRRLTLVLLLLTGGVAAASALLALAG